MSIFLIFLPISSIIGLSIAYARLLKARFIFTPPVILSLIIIFQFFFDVLGLLYHVTLFLVIIGNICLLYYLYADSTTRQNIFKYKYEILSFSALVFIYFMFVRDHVLFIHDDFAFWGVFSKDLLFNHKVYSNEVLSPILPSHNHYPRGPSFFHYYIMLFSDFSEPNVLLAHFVMHVLFAMPYFANRYTWQSLLLFALLYLLPVMHTFGLISILNDSTIGFIGASILAIFIQEKNKSKAFLLIIPILIAISIFRESGLWFCMAISLIIFVAFLHNNSDISNAKKIFTLIGLLMLPLIGNYCWFSYVDHFNALGRAPHKLEDVINIISSLIAGEEKNWNIVKIFLYTLFQIMINKSFIFIYITILTTFCFIYIYEQEKIKLFVKLIITSFIGFFLFFLFRLYIYILMADIIYGLSVSTQETNSLIRYLICYMCIFIALSNVFIKETLFKKNWVFPSFPVLLLYILIFLAYYFFKFKIKGLIIYSTLLLIVFNYLKPKETIIKLKTFVLFILLYYLGQNIIPYLKMLPSEKTLNTHEKVFREQTTILKSLLRHGFNLEYNFQYEEPLIKKTERCYYLSFHLTPYFHNQTTINCLHYSNSTGDKHLIKRNSLDSNIDINHVLKEPKKYNCKIKYYANFNYIKIDCKER